MSQQYPQPMPPQKKKRGKGCLFAALGAAVFAVIIVAASSNDGDDTSSSPKPSVPQTTAAASAEPSGAPEPSSPAEQFTAYVKAKGTQAEQEAVAHVTKIQGADSDNDILDTADIYTDYTGDLVSGDASSGKLIASAFADWQASRGKDSKNGLVTVYNKSGELLSNGKY